MTALERKRANLRTRRLIAACGDDTIGVMADGTVVATSSCFDGTVDGRGFEEKYPEAKWNDICAVAMDFHTTLGLKSDGSVVYSGSSLGPSYRIEERREPVKVKDIACLTSGISSMLLREDGVVVYFNSVSYEEIAGCAAVENGGYIIRKDGTVDMDSWHISSGLMDYRGTIRGRVAAVAGAEDHILILYEDGTVDADERDYVMYQEYAGGCEEVFREERYDIRTGTDEWTDIIAIAVGSGHAVGLKSDGTVVAAGKNNYGQCDVSGWTDIIAIAAGYHHTVGLRADGTVLAVGKNNHMQCEVDDWRLFENLHGLDDEWRRERTLFAEILAYEKEKAEARRQAERLERYEQRKAELTQEANRLAREIAHLSWLGKLTRKKKLRAELSAVLEQRERLKL